MTRYLGGDVDISVKSQENSTKPYNKATIKKQQAVELWRETRGHISNICRAIGIDRGTFYNWMNNDPDFARSLLDAEAELNDDVRDALIQKVADGDLGAITFYLKSRHPDFKPQPTVQVNQQNNFIGDDQFKRIIGD